MDILRRPATVAVRRRRPVHGRSGLPGFFRQLVVAVLEDRDFRIDELARNAQSGNPEPVADRDDVLAECGVDFFR